MSMVDGICIRVRGVSAAEHLQWQDMKFRTRVRLMRSELFDDWATDDLNGVQSIRLQSENAPSTAANLVVSSVDRQRPTKFWFE